MTHVRTATRYQGQIILITLVFFAIFVSVTTAFIGFLLASEREVRMAIASVQARALAEAGIDQAAYQLNQNQSYAGETDTALGNGAFTVTVSTIDGSSKQITVTGQVPGGATPVARETIKAVVSIDTSVVSFHYGVQAGNGGFDLSNSSKIIGNVFSTGPVIGHNSNLIYGSVVSSGTSGLVYGVHATSSVYAHTIGNAGGATTIDKDAYYVTKTNTTVTGTSYPGSSDQNSVALPISDAQINEWESYAADGGTISACDGNGDYTISSSQSLGPKKIACNLVVKSSSGVLTITGPLWVTGNITFQTGPTIKMDPALGSQNVALIADNPSDTTGSGIIDVGQSTSFQGSGAPGSFVFLISQNNSAETGGATTALALSQGASALVAYASHGLATLSQSVNVKAVTAYKIALSQSASVTYDTGLPSTAFESGPGGSWVFVPGSYAIAP